MRYTKAVLAAVTAAALVGVIVPAAAGNVKYEQPTVSKVAPTVLATDGGGRTAFVVGTYRCFGGSPTHLYIGVKQGPDINATTHTSSQYAKTFYSTNWNADGPGDTITCDGVTHTQSFQLKPDPYWAHAGDKPPALSSGPAFVQFCVFDSTNQGENDPNGFAFNYSMRTVQVF